MTQEVVQHNEQECDLPYTFKEAHLPIVLLSEKPASEANYWEDHESFQASTQDTVTGEPINPANVGPMAGIAYT
jgi:hypothetical protein